MRENIRSFLALHILLLIYSVSSVCSKLAASQPMGSFPFFMMYGGVILALGIYALGWQQVIKHLPLTAAYANKAVTVVWGMILGTVFFQEQLCARQILGAAVVIVGVVLFTCASTEEFS